MMQISKMEVKQLIERRTLFEVLRTALIMDEQTMQNTNLYSVYRLWIGRVLDRISAELLSIKERLQLSQVDFLREEQRKKERWIQFRFHGEELEVSFPNQWIKKECEHLLKQLLSLR